MITERGVELISGREGAPLEVMFAGFMPLTKADVMQITWR
jgi:hypothetical protein